MVLNSYGIIQKREMNVGKIKTWISQHMDWAICIGVCLFVGIWALYLEIYWETWEKCKVADCRNDRLTDHDYCKDHTCQHEDCYDLCVDGRIYCEAHIHCKYENCWRTLREGEVDYCDRHQQVVSRRKEEARKKEESEYKAREAARKAAREAEKAEAARLRREYAKISGQGSGGRYYDSYDSGYDDVYDGDYDDRRYQRDSEYANGVDDAIDELGDDW